jgi:hypothetical protein
MSIESVSDTGEGNELLFSDYDVEDEEEEEVIGRRYDEEEVFGDKSNSKLNRGMLKDKNLRIEVPFMNRRVTDCELELRRFALKNSTPASERRPHTLSSKGSVYWDLEDIRTPSAPPIMESGQEDSISLEIEKDIQKIEDEICGEAGVESSKQESMRSSSHLYRVEEFGESVKDSKTVEDSKISEICSDELEECHSISGQYAWQSLLAYDACIRLCLYEWSKGSTEASEFLRDECRILRGAFGLHKFLLQPRGVRSSEKNNNVKAEPKPSLKSKNVVRKLRVEVKRLRLIPQRKLRGTDSLRSLMNMQIGMGAEYCRQVSSLVKTGMTSIKQATLSAVSEGLLLIFGYEFNFLRRLICDLSTGLTQFTKWKITFVR